jgi:hypothetical protein
VSLLTQSHEVREWSATSQSLAPDDCGLQSFSVVGSTHRKMFGGLKPITAEQQRIRQLERLRTSVFTTCATPGHPGTAKREHLAMNSKTWEAGSLERWWTATPNLQRRTCCLQRLESNAEEVERTWWTCHVIVTPRKTKAPHFHARPCVSWLLNLGSTQGPTD